MTEFHFGTLNSTVRMSDSQTALNPDVFERIVSAAVDRVREEMAHEQRVTSERRVRPGASSSQSANWE